MLDELLERLAADEEQLLNCVDLATRWAWPDTTMNPPQKIVALYGALSEAGSAWEVALDPDKRPCLERKVDATVAAAAHELMTTSGRAGRHLASAWHDVYKRDPAASEGYREAVRVVEVAAIPIVIPNDSGATLEKVIPALRNASNKWRIVLTPSGSDPVETVAHMCELLWKSQWDRHGVSDESVPLNVSLPEAQAAVHLASTLVQWFTSGAVMRAQP